MKVLIAGGTGLIGTALCHLMVEKGAAMVVLTRSSSPSDSIPGVKYVTWMNGSPDWMKELDGADVIINLAGESLGSGRWTRSKKHQILQSRVNAGAKLVEAITRAVHKPIHFVQSSGIGYYGVNLVESFTEDSPNGKDYLSRLAQIWEDTTKAVESVGVIRSIIRTGIVLDSRQGALAQMLLPYRLFVGGPLGSGRQWMSWIHRLDEVRAIDYIISHHLGGVFNLTSPNPVRNREMGITIAETLSRPYWMPVPDFALKALLGEMSTLVLDGQKVLPARLLESGFDFQYPHLSVALKDILSEVKPKKG